MDFYILDPATKKYSLLAPYDASVSDGAVNSDARFGGGREAKVSGESLYFISTVTDSSVLMRIDRYGNISTIVGEEGACDSFDIFNGKAVYCALRGNLAAELYDAQGRRLTHFSPENLSLSTPEYLSFKSGGDEIHGWVMKPVGYLPGKKYPAILHIHGGPRTVFGNVLHHEMQLWAAEGYFVFFCNPHGSDGRGIVFGCIDGKYGTVDYDDIMRFTDIVTERYPDIDTERLGVTGGSYGGFMTNWIIGHTNRFKCAVSQRSIANWVSFEHTSDIGPSFTFTQMTSTTQKNVEKLWFHSPLKYASHCTTPTLFIHSDRDYRCWMAEGLTMFTALKIAGCETRLCLFKDECHDLSRSGKPRSRIRRMEEILSWMNKYLKG